MRRARQTAVLLLVLLLLTVVGVHLYAQVFRWRAEHLLAQLKTFRVEETPAATVLKLRSDYSLHVVGDAPCSEAHCAFSIELTEWGSLVKARRPWNERLIDYLTTGPFRFFGLRVYDLTVEFRIENARLRGASVWLNTMSPDFVIRAQTVGNFRRWVDHPQVYAHPAFSMRNSTVRSYTRNPKNRNRPVVR